MQKCISFLLMSTVAFVPAWAVPVNLTIAQLVPIGNLPVSSTAVCPDSLDLLKF